jgi:hypothetical protein
MDDPESKFRDSRDWLKLVYCNIGFVYLMRLRIEMIGMDGMIDQAGDRIRDSETK